VSSVSLHYYLYSLTRQFFLSESVLVANPELRVSRTEGCRKLLTAPKSGEPNYFLTLVVALISDKGRLSRSGSKTYPGYSCYDYICRDRPSFRTSPLHITVSFPCHVRTVFLFHLTITVRWLAFKNV